MAINYLSTASWCPSCRAAFTKLIKVKDKIIHISFDIDVIDPILGPSTGTTVDKGLNMYDIYTILNNITKNNLIASCDFVEYNSEIGSIKEKERTLNYMELSINTVIKNL